MWRRYIGRLVKNDMEIAKALRSRFENHSPPPGYRGVVIRFVDMQDSLSPNVSLTT